MFTLHLFMFKPKEPSAMGGQHHEVAANILRGNWRIPALHWILWRQPSKRQEEHGGSKCLPEQMGGYSVSAWNEYWNSSVKGQGDTFTICEQHSSWVTTLVWQNWNSRVHTYSWKSQSMQSCCRNYVQSTPYHASAANRRIPYGLVDAVEPGNKKISCTTCNVWH